MFKNNHTLEKRISRSINLSIILTVIFLSLFIFIASGQFIKKFTQILPSAIAKNISDELSSNSFLYHMQIKSIDEFDSTVPGFNQWKDKLDNLLNMKNLLEYAGVTSTDTFTDSNIDYEYMGVVVEINDNVIYNNTPFSANNNEIPPESKFKNSNSLSDSVKSWFNKNFAPKITFDINNSDGAVIGHVIASLNIQLTSNIIIFLTLLFLLSVFISINLSSFISKYFMKPIIMPLKRLQEILNNTADGNLEDTLNNPIKIKKPLKEISELVESTNKIISKIKNYTRLLESKNSQLRIMTTNQKKINTILAQKNNQLQYIMDNIGQGFLTFNTNLLITEEYSLSCKELFNTEISNKKLSQLLYPDDIESIEFIDSIFSKLLSPKSNGDPQLYIDLLPEEIKINNRNISLEYKIINDLLTLDFKSMIVILTDITEKKSLERKMNDERNILKMVVSSMVYKNNLIDCISLYKTFVNLELSEILTSNISVNEKVVEIFRRVHNFKGNFSQFDFINISSKLHLLEDDLERVKSTPFTLEEFSNFINTFDLLQWLDEDIKIIENFLGKGFFNQNESILIDKDTLQRLEEKVLETLSFSDSKELLPHIKSLSYKPFRELLLSYVSYVDKLSVRLNKPLNPLIISCEDFSVDLDHYKGFTNSLIHVFKNCIDHGIESIEERSLLDKNEYGTIKCIINKIDENIIIKISDDGRGISLDDIKKVAIEKGLLEAAEADKASDVNIADFIFKDSFSTKEEITEVSGRGVGLYSVLKELNKINGTVKINSKVGLGTEFIFTIPIKQEIETPKFSTEEIFNTIVETGRNFINSEALINISEPIEILPCNKLNLNTISSIIFLKGILKGVVIISINTSLSKKLINNFIIEPLGQDEENKYIEDIVSECSNIIIGNSLKKFGEIENYVSLSTPKIMWFNGTSAKYSKENILTCELEYNEFSVKFYFIPTTEF